MNQTDLLTVQRNIFSKKKKKDLNFLLGLTMLSYDLEAFVHTSCRLFLWLYVVLALALSLRDRSIFHTVTLCMCRLLACNFSETYLYHGGLKAICVWNVMFLNLRVIFFFRWTIPLKPEGHWLIKICHISKM